MPDNGHGPLESYQWSAARVAQQARFSRAATVVLVGLVLASCLLFQVWNSVSAHRAGARINCEISGWNKLWSAVVADQNAEASHHKPPPFNAPKPC